MVRTDPHALSATTPFLKRLLVATDGSPSGDRAVAFAIALAKSHGSELEFCNAFDRNAATQACCTLQGENALAIPLLGQLEDNAASIVKSARDRAAADGVVATTEVLLGPAVSAILDCENDHRIDAVVMGTEGTVGLERVLAGSTADGVLRRSIVPVFVIPPGASASVGAGQTRVLLAVDDSEPSDAALAFALDFAAARRAELIVCSIALPAPTFLTAESYAFDPRAMQKELHDGAVALVAIASDRARDRGIRCQRFVADGDPAKAILAAAVEKRADLIVVGTHGRRGVRRWLVGSVAERVVRRSPLPVVVVRTSRARVVHATNGHSSDFSGD